MASTIPRHRGSALRGDLHNNNDIDVDDDELPRGGERNIVHTAAGTSTSTTGTTAPTPAGNTTGTVASTLNKRSTSSSSFLRRLHISRSGGKGRGGRNSNQHDINNSHNNNSTSWQQHGSYAHLSIQAQAQAQAHPPHGAAVATTEAPSSTLEEQPLMVATAVPTVPTSLRSEAAAPSSSSSASPISNNSNNNNSSRRLRFLGRGSSWNVATIMPLVKNDIMKHQQPPPPPRKSLFGCNQDHHSPSSCEDRADSSMLCDNEYNNNTNSTNTNDKSHCSTTQWLSHCSVLEFLQLACPSDVVPKVMAYAGPQTAAALFQTNRYWKLFMQQEATWRVMCEELYKWKLGDPEPESWKEFYRLSPCVPVDFPTVPKALGVVEDRPIGPSNRRMSIALHQTKSVRILMRPGNYYVKEALQIRAIEGVTISFETMQLPENIFRPRPSMTLFMNSPIPESAPSNVSIPSSSTSPLKKTATSLRMLMRCNRPAAAEDPTERSGTDLGFECTDDWCDNLLAKQHAPKHASLILRTRRYNEPVFRVKQGHLHLFNMEIQHTSHGLDIWNGNAAIQIQPANQNPDEFDEEEEEDNTHHPSTDPPVDPMPSVTMDRVHVTSRSGRGIVNIDGGQLHIRRCAVSQCAATGIYVGGHGSRAVIEHSDVVQNGLGNRHRRGIARGHSGIYLEQGQARIEHCTVAHNTLTGISSVSPDNAILHVQHCDLMVNGTMQLEMPGPETRSRQLSMVEHNIIGPIVRGTGGGSGGVVGSSGRMRSEFITALSSSSSSLLNLNRSNSSSSSSSLHQGSSQHAAMPDAPVWVGI